MTFEDQCSYKYLLNSASIGYANKFKYRLPRLLRQLVSLPDLPPDLRPKYPISTRPKSPISTRSPRSLLLCGSVVLYVRDGMRHKEFYEYGLVSGIHYVSVDTAQVLPPTFH